MTTDDLRDLSQTLRPVLEWLDDMTDGAPDASSDAKEAGRHSEAIRDLLRRFQKGRLDPLRNMIRQAKEAMAESGGCDHSVGICACKDLREIEEAEAALKRAEA